MRGNAALCLGWRRSDDLEDSSDDLPVLQLDFGVREAQNAKTLCRQTGVSHCIPFGIVKRAIRLGHQSISQADKVQNVGSERDLPPELQSFQPSISQQFPQQALRLRRVAAQSTGLRDGRGASHGAG